MIRHIFYRSALCIFMLILCVTDVLTYFLCEYHTTYFLLTFLIAYYWRHQSIFIMAFGTLLLASESLIIDAGCSTALISALPLFMLIHIIKPRLYSTPLAPIATVATALLVDIYLVRGFIQGLHTPPLYTISILCGNIFIVFVFSLKLSGGKTRQSLMPLV